MEGLWQRIKSDDAFVRQYQLDSVRETLTLDYSSYILALAMGAGKTVLIGAIIATEFAMALEHPDGPFIENALVFAPGRTILESLRELVDIPYDQILPPRLFRPFAASFKPTFTRDGEKDLPIIRGSRFNMVVTNTEKIRIQKPTIRANRRWTQLELLEREKQEAEIANLRLQAIASLPHLGIFSDEAHHTYGQPLGAELKKVRRTVDYLAANTNVVCVVNTTGTPYYQRQPLKDVVVWYGLSQGIRDNILKDVSGSIHAYSFDNQHTADFVAEVVRDFFTTYGEVRLPNGAPAKLAIYFPQNDDLVELRPRVEQALAEVGQSPAVVLRNTSQSSTAEIDAFNRLNDPASPYRVILLVDKGTEGWNCPSLFACALARRLRNSNNFVLQASTRCLRQVSGNTHKARIYLSMDNRSILDRQLQETYGESIAQLNATDQNTRTARLVLRKTNVSPLVVKRTIRSVVPKNGADQGPLTLTMPYVTSGAPLVRQTYELAPQPGSAGVLRQIEEAVVSAETDVLDLYTAAVDLAATYRVDSWHVYSQLKSLYSESGVIPANHLPHLAQQIEARTRNYEVREEQIEDALALLKADGFMPEEEAGTVIYTAKITYPMDRESLLLPRERLADANSHDFGFHYTPYNFDSHPEQDFFTEMLRYLNTAPDEVEDIYFTGALTDPNKTDLYVEYLGEDNRPHRYTPDFIIRKKNGRCLIVEIKAERDRHHPVNGQEGRKAIALRRWADVNPDLLKYEMVFTATDSVAFNQLQPARQFIERS